eukprot:scaffold106618_cov77-Phaeocystis_antarctica.AAC.1
MFGVCKRADRGRDRATQSNVWQSGEGCGHVAGVWPRRRIDFRISARLERYYGTFGPGALHAPGSSYYRRLEPLAGVGPRACDTLNGQRLGAKRRAGYR